jgi:cholinesterase
MTALWLSSLFALFFFSPFESFAKPLHGRVDFAVGQPVKSTSGTLIGHAASTRGQVSEYLGIPFAQPPTGQLRFAAPQPFNGNGTIVASQYVSHYNITEQYWINDANINPYSHRKS